MKATWIGLIALTCCVAAGAVAEGNGMFVSMRDAYLGPDIFDSTAAGCTFLGVDNIEVAIDHDFSVRALDSKDRVTLTTNEDAQAYRKRADELGIHIWATLTACDFSAKTMEENVAFLARAVEISDILGASAMRIDSAMRKEKELDFDARVNLFVEGLSAVLAKTADSKVTLGIENHGFQGNNLAFLLNIYQQVNSPRLGSTLDTGNFYWRGYPLSEVYGILRVLAPYAKHTHVKNINYPEDQREVTREAGWKYAEYFSRLEKGDIDVAKVVKILAKAGYTGDICIEDESVSKCATREERAAATKENVDFIKRVIAEAGQ